MRRNRAADGNSGSRTGLGWTRDGYIVVAARGLRMFSYGFLSVVLALYLASLGLSAAQIGIVFTVTLAGGATTTVLISLVADRWGRRRTLVASALVAAATGVALALTDSFPVILVIAALGTLSPSGEEVGPFQSLEQAALAESSAQPGRALPYAWYNLVASFSRAGGALVAGFVPSLFEAAGWSTVAAQRSLIWAFVVVTVVLSALFLFLSPAVEAVAVTAGSRRGGLHQSRSFVLRLGALMGLDAMAGGLVMQSLVAFWFHQRYGVGLQQLGPLFSGTHLLAAFSFLVSAKLADRFGLLRTMVFTHIPANIFLLMVPLMPTWPLAALLLLLRHALSQMDVPARQAYTMILVTPSERAAAAGVTNAIRIGSSSVAPVISGVALQAATSGIPFFLAGALKLTYDVALWLTFRRVPLTAPRPQ